MTDTTCNTNDETGRDTFMSRPQLLDYSERRKFSRFCLLVAERALKLAITLLASEPLLACCAIAVSRLAVRPSCRKKIRWPSPHNGEERNWSPPAPPCETLSFRPVPMWWTSRSLKRFAVTLPSPGVRDEAEVASEGVWHEEQPIELNSDLPALMEVEPPGVVVDGAGGADKRMNMENFTTSLDVPNAVWLNCVWSSGVPLMRQFAGRPVVWS